MKSIQPQAGSEARAGRAQGVWLLALFAAVGAVVFHALWSPGAVLMTTDDNVGLLKGAQRMLEGSLLHPWTGETLWGLPGLSGIRPGYWLLTVLSAEAYMNLFHGLCLALAAWLLALHLRDRGLRPAACAFGGLVAFWVGTNLTLTYAGHVGKYGMMVFLALAVFALGRWEKTGKLAWSVVAGAATGAMFLEQADVALFCALLLAPLGLFAAARAAGGWTVGAIAKRAWPALLAAALLVGGTSLAAKGSGVTEVPGEESPGAQWAYLTQWSQPPEESLDFIAPGWTGWRSGEERGPYWGRMGRSEGWERTRQGFMNFKLETTYVGAVPFLFALVGLGEAFRRRRTEPEASAAVLGWGALGLVALLLAFGKFFVLYKPLSLLPGFSSIRNPNKFIHFFQVAWGVLAAFGLEAAGRLEPRISRRWRGFAAGLAGILLLAGLALWADLGSGAARLSAAGWGPLGRAIQWNKAFSLTYAGGALLAGAGILWLLAGGVFHGVEKSFPQGGKKGVGFSTGGKNFSTAWKTAGAWLPALVVVFDAAVILAPKYIQTMPKGFVAENELVQYLKREVGPNRTAMVGQDGFYNLWLTYLFPYHGIPSVNVTQLPRPPADYSAFWDAVRDPVRSWRLTAVSHVLAHGPVAAQLRSDPLWAAQLEPAWAYHPLDDGRGGVATRRAPVTASVPEVVLKLKPVPPRVAAVRSWRTAEDAEALKTLGDPAFTPFDSVLLAPGGAVPPPPAGDPGPPAEVEITRLLPGRHEFTVKNSGPVVVRVAEKHDPNWKATVDGKPASVLRVDYMFQGVALTEAGTHRVAMWYAPPRTPVLLQGAGLLAGVAAAAWLAVSRRRKEPAA